MWSPGGSTANRKKRRSSVRKDITDYMVSTVYRLLSRTRDFANSTVTAAPPPSTSIITDPPSPLFLPPSRSICCPPNPISNLLSLLPPHFFPSLFLSLPVFPFRDGENGIDISVSNIFFVFVQGRRSCWEYFQGQVRINDLLDYSIR